MLRRFQRGGWSGSSKLLVEAYGKTAATCTTPDWRWWHAKGAKHFKATAQPYSKSTTGPPLHVHDAEDEVVRHVDDHYFGVVPPSREVRPEVVVLLGSPPGWRSLW